MASPAVAAVTEGGLTANGTSLPVTLPGGGASTDFYLVIIAKGSVATTINALADWAEVVDANTAADLAILYYTGAGVPSNPTFTQAASSRSVWGALRITGSSRAVAPTIGTIATGSSTTPDPPAATVANAPQDILAVACFARAGEIADDDTLVTTFPTNYTSGQIEKSGGTGGVNLAGILGVACRQVTGASSENPGTFTIITGAWRAQTIIVYPTPAGVDHTVNPDDSLSLADARGFTQGKSVADSTALADARAFARGKGLTDTLSPSDVLSRVVVAARTIPDTVGLSDSRAISQGQAIADMVSLSDNLNAAKGKAVNLGDSIILTDQLARTIAYGRTVTDGVNLQDATRDSQGIRLGDTVVLADQLARAIQAARGIVDSVTLADARAIAQGQLIADSVTLADLVDPDITTGATGHTRDINDTVVLADARAISQGQGLTDTISVSDLFARQLARGLLIQDQVTLTDGFFRTVTYLRNPADLVVLTDAVLTARVRAMLLSDQVDLTDAQTVSNGILTALLEPIYTGQLGRGSTGQSGSMGQGGIADTVAGVVEEEVEV